MASIASYKWGIAIAFFVGFCAVLPAIVGPLYLGDAYSGIEYAPLDDEEIYRARIHEILDGHGSVAHAFLYEYKDASVPMPPVNEWLYALPAIFFGLAGVILVSKFLLSAVIFFLAYLLLQRITGDELTALAGGLLVFFSVELVDYGYLFNLLQGGWPRPLLWTRLVNPAVGAVEVLGFLNLLWIVIEKRIRYAPYVAGAVLALTVGYYFAFGISIALLGILGLVFLYRREYVIFFDLVKIGVVAAVCTIPYWYLVVSAIGSSDESAMRIGMFLTHAPVFNKVLIVASAVVTIAYVFARRRGHFQAAAPWLFSFSLLAAGWIAFNEQVITGREIWHHHFVQYATPLASLAVVIALFFSLRDEIERLWQWAMSAIVALLIVFGLYSMLSVIPRVDALGDQQAYGALFEWLNTEAEKECVVFVYENEEVLARFVPAYSHCNVYITSITFSGVPMERINHNYFLRMRMFGVAAEGAKSYLRAHEVTVRGTFFEDWNQALMNTDPEWFEALVPQLAAQYSEFVRGDLEAQLRTYRIDYIVGEEEMPATIMAQLPNLRYLTNVGRYHVYTFGE